MKRRRYSSKRLEWKAGKNKKLDILIIVVVTIVIAVSFLSTKLSDRSALEDSSAADGECELHMIDVGQGDAFLIRVGKDNVLIDAGPNDGESALEAYLTENGITSFDYVVFTHPHEDHIGGGDMVFENFEVEKVLMPDVISNTSVFENLLECIDASGADVITPLPGDTYSVGELSLMILGPSEYDENELNNCSLVMRAEYGDISMLFSGDAEKSVELDVCDKYTDELDCDIYKVAHHGSSTSNCDRFLGAVSPDLALISCGLGNSYGHPHHEVIDKLNEMGVTVKRTDTDGNVTVAIDGEKYWIKEG